MDWETILKVGGGFLTGSFATTVFNWWTSKRKDEKQRRREQIAAWRAWVATLPDKGGWIGGGEEERAILQSAEFQSLEPHLDAELVTRLRKRRDMMIGFSLILALSKRISELEKEWGLL